MKRIILLLLVAIIVAFCVFSVSAQNEKNGLNEGSDAEVTEQTAIEQEETSFGISPVFAIISFAVLSIVGSALLLKKCSRTK